MDVSRDEAWALFCEWTQSDSLRKHVLGVEAAMVGYAREYGEDEELWAATGIVGLTPKSVKKKLKQPSFAAGVNRDEVRQGAEELGVDFDEHIAKVIAAMEERADVLGLGPREDAAA